MEISLWLSRLRTPSTRRVYRIFLNNFLQYNSATWQDSIEWQEPEIEDRMLLWRDFLMSEDLAHSSIRTAWGAVRKWFTDNRKRIIISCDVGPSAKTYLDYIPTKEDVRLLLNEANLRYKVIISIIAFSGMRPIDIIGLQYKHIKASFEKGDEVLTLIKKQQKTRQWYFTFISPQSTSYLRQWLGQYAKWSERELTDDTYLVATRQWGKSTSQVIRKAIGRIIQRTVGKHPTGESFRKFRPYGLRKYFRRAASALGEDLAEFLMGHSKGLNSMTATYSGLKDMDPLAIEDMKKQYIKIIPDLETEITDISLDSKFTQLSEKEKERDIEMDEIKRELAHLKARISQTRLDE